MKEDRVGKGTVREGTRLEEQLGWPGSHLVGSLL